MKLYEVQTYGLGRFMVVADSPDQAEKRVAGMLRNPMRGKSPRPLEGYGSSYEQKVTTITLIAEESNVVHTTTRHDEPVPMLLLRDWVVHEHENDPEPEPAVTMDLGTDYDKEA